MIYVGNLLGSAAEFLTQLIFYLEPKQLLAECMLLCSTMHIPKDKNVINFDIFSGLFSFVQVF
jgi:hypothetical protein